MVASDSSARIEWKNSSRFYPKDSHRKKRKNMSRGSRRFPGMRCPLRRTVAEQAERQAEKLLSTRAKPIARNVFPYQGWSIIPCRRDWVNRREYRVQGSGRIGEIGLLQAETFAAGSASGFRPKDDDPMWRANFSRPSDGATNKQPA